MRLEKRIFSMVLCLALVLSGMTIPIKEVQAEEVQLEETYIEKTQASSSKTIPGLGAGMITDPVNPGEDTTKAWTGSYVYFGNYDADGNLTAEPVKYRVLDVSTTEYSADQTTQTMLLDCDSVLHKQVFDADSNEWASSEIKTYLNSESGFLATSFSKAEQNAIEASIKAAADASDGSDVAAYGFAPLGGEKIFILDIREATRPSYGYSNTQLGAKNRDKKLYNSKLFGWWTRSRFGSSGVESGYVVSDETIGHMHSVSDYVGVSPALNINLSSILFSSVLSGNAGQPGAEYKLTLLDSDITIASSGVKRIGNTVTIPYSIDGANAGNVTQLSVLILDKEYTAGNTSGASILAYEKLNVENFAVSGTGIYTIPDSFIGKTPGVDYHVYLIAEDINGEKGSDYASAPLEIPIWAAPTVKQICIGAQGIVDPAVPSSEKDNWNGCYVYYGAYDIDGDQVTEPVKYRVLDASTTKFGKATMFLDCDSILFQSVFDSDGVRKWANSDIKQTLNGDGGLVRTAFTGAEQNAIAASTVGSHALTTDSETEVNVSTGLKNGFENYVALGGEKLFLLDAEDVCNGAYGYGMDGNPSRNRKKTGASADTWWLRSVYEMSWVDVGIVPKEGGISSDDPDNTSVGVSPAMNLDLSSILFSSVSGVDKTSALTRDSNGIGMTTDAQWKLTLLDVDKTIALTPGRSAVKIGDGTITVPYTYTDSASGSGKVNQISVAITDKTYGSENAQILYYGALQNIKNAEGTDAVVAEATTGTGTFALPSGLTGTLGTDYHVYVLAEHVNAECATDYASKPLEIGVKMSIPAVNIPGIDTPIAGLPLTTEVEVSGEGVIAKAPVTWKKGETTATGKAESNMTYRAFVTLTAKEGYTFVDATGVLASITLNGKAVGSNQIAWNADGTLTIACGVYTTAAEVKTDDSQVSVKHDGTVTYVAPTDKTVTSVTIPDTVIVGGVARKVTAIEKNAFKNSKIKSITIGNNIKTIGANAFYGCKNLKSVKFGKNVTTIGDKAFYKCTALTKITIPSKVKTIGKQAFYGCKKLKTVTIGKAVSKIGAKAFYGCNKLKTLTIKTTRLTMKKVGSKAFGKTPKSMKVTVPKKKFKSYKSMLVKKGVSKKAKFKKK